MRFPRASTAIILPLLAPASAAAASLQTVGEYASPVHVTSDPGDPNRLFVVEQDGRIQRTQGGATTTFLNIDSIVRSSGEPVPRRAGVAVMAFSPDYETTGLFYVFYTGEDDGATGANESGAVDVDEFDASKGGAIATTRREVIEILHTGWRRTTTGGSCSSARTITYRLHRRRGDRSRRGGTEQLAGQGRGIIPRGRGTAITRCRRTIRSQATGAAGMGAGRSGATGCATRGVSP